MATFSKMLTLGLAPALTGLATSISYKVYDSAGVLKLTRTNVMTEEVTASGAGSGSYYHIEAGFDDTWSFPLRVNWLVTGFELSIPSDVIEALSDLGTIEADLAEVKAKTDLIVPETPILIAPLLTDGGSQKIVADCDYLRAENNPVSVVAPNFFTRTSGYTLIGEIEDGGTTHTLTGAVEGGIVKIDLPAGTLSDGTYTLVAVAVVTATSKRTPLASVTLRVV